MWQLQRRSLALNLEGDKNTMVIENLVKNRSISSCISAGHNLWNKNFMSLCRYTIWHLLTTALAMSITIILLLESVWYFWQPALLLTVFLFSAFNNKSLRFIANVPMRKERLSLISRSFPGYLSFSLLASTISLTIYMIIAIPLFILLYCHIANQNSIIQGDDNSQTAFFTILLYLTTFVTSVTILCIHTWKSFAIAFLFGRMMAKENVENNEKDTAITE